MIVISVAENSVAENVDFSEKWGSRYNHWNHGRFGPRLQNGLDAGSGNVRAVAGLPYFGELRLLRWGQRPAPSVLKPGWANASGCQTISLDVLSR